MIKPVEYKILVKLDNINDTDPVLKRAKALGLELPQKESEREQMAQVKGSLVEVGGNAFEDWQPPIPKVGDRVMIAKHTGFIAIDNDEEYRICNDKDIMAVIGE